MSKQDKPQRLTDLELEIMQVVWKSSGAALTVRAVVDQLHAQGEKDHAYTTIQTMLGILCRKHALESRPGPGRAHLYSPLITRQQATHSMTRDFVERLFGGDAQPLVAALITDQKVSREELEDLRRMIDAQLDDEGDQGLEVQG